MNKVPSTPHESTEQKTALLYDRFATKSTHISVGSALLEFFDGNAYLALVFHQICYWDIYYEHRGFYNTHAMWAAQTGIKAKTVRNQIAKLKSMGFLETWVGGQIGEQKQINTTWYRVNWDAVHAAIDAHNNADFAGARMEPNRPERAVTPPTKTPAEGNRPEKETARSGSLSGGQTARNGRFLYSTEINNTEITAKREKNFIGDKTLDQTKTDDSPINQEDQSTRRSSREPASRQLASKPVKAKQAMYADQGGFGAAAPSRPSKEKTEADLDWFFAEQLAEAKSDSPYTLQGGVRAWAKEFRLLRTKDAVPVHRIREILMFYIQLKPEWDDQFTPKIANAADFRKKFNKLEAYKARVETPQDTRSKTAKLADQRRQEFFARRRERCEDAA